MHASRPSLSGPPLVWVRLKERAESVGWMTRRCTVPERSDTENELQGQTFSEDTLDRLRRIIAGRSTSELS